MPFICWPLLSQAPWPLNSSVTQVTPTSTSHLTSTSMNNSHSDLQSSIQIPYYLFTQWLQGLIHPFLNCIRPSNFTSTKTHSHTSLGLAKPKWPMTFAPIYTDLMFHGVQDEPPLFPSFEECPPLEQVALMCAMLCCWGGIAREDLTADLQRVGRGRVQPGSWHSSSMQQQGHAGHRAACKKTTMAQNDQRNRCETYEQ